MKQLKVIAIVIACAFISCYFWQETFFSGIIRNEAGEPISKASFKVICQLNDVERQREYSPYMYTFDTGEYALSLVAPGYSSKTKISEIYGYCTFEIKADGYETQLIQKSGNELDEMAVYNDEYDYYRISQDFVLIKDEEPSPEE